MLRSMVFRLPRAVSSVRTNHTMQMGPSTTTSVLLSRLPLSLTEADLIKALESVKCRRVNLEPGCSLHFLSETEAYKAGDFISSNFGVETQVSKASIPGISLQNIPVSVSAENLRSSFQSVNPLNVSITTSHEAVLDAELPAQVICRFPPDTRSRINEVASVIEKTGGDSIDKVQVIKLKKPSLFIRNVSHLKSESSLSSLLNSQAASIVSGVERVQLLRETPDKKPHMAVVYFHSEEAALACMSALHSTQLEGKRITAAYREVSTPALTLSNLPSDVTEQEIRENLLPSIELVSVDILPGVSADEGTKYAQVVLSGPRDMQVALNKCNFVPFRGHNILAVQDDLYDTGLAAHLAPNASVEEAHKCIERVLQQQQQETPLAAKSTTYHSNRHGIVNFASTQAAQRALNKYIGGDVKLLVEATATAEANDEVAAGEPAGLSRGGGGGGGAEGGSLVSASLTTTPSSVLQVQGLSSEIPVGAVLDALGAALPDLRVIQADRSALVKFRRHKEVVPGMKQLKELAVSGPLAGGGESGDESEYGLVNTSMRVQRYRPLEAPGDSEYDVSSSRDSEYDTITQPSSRSQQQLAVNQFSLEAALKDFMDFDPSTRYGIAKDAFERALFDARASGDLSALFDESLTAEAQNEVRELFFKQGPRVAAMTEESINARLFELFLQKEEMRRYSRDFNEIEALLGKADESSAFDWSQFDIETGQDLERIMKEMKKADEKAVDDLMKEARVGNFRAVDGSGSDEAVAPSSGDSTTIAGSDVVVLEKDDKNASTTAEKKKDLTRLTIGTRGELTDAEGNLWSACILDTDMVQKTMPGNRVNSHRALVVIGNLRGAAGFGMGKGKTGADAVNAACRAAMRNLTHIDLYDNYGLAHDLYGRHNSCHVYIKATPNAREMVASPFATEVLTRFGIASASVKVVGNRNPYSTVNAIFNAIRQHENIDEYAKDRGQRYLTLRWAHDQNI